MNKLKRRWKYWFIVLFSLTSVEVQSQTVQINIAHSETKEPIENAHISFVSKQNTKDLFLISDSNGNIFIPLSDSVSLTISHIAYLTHKVFIEHLHSDYTVFLKPVVFNLSEFVITAQRHIQPQKESVYSIKTIDAEKINSKGASTINEALSNELNMRFSYRPSFGSNVNLQGFSGEQVNIMIDGVPVTGRLNGNLDLQQINLNNTERVEVLYGPVSVVYGSNSSGGAINLISSKYGKKPYSLKSTVYTESVGQYNFSATASAVNRSKNIFAVSVGRNFFGGYSPMDTSRHKLWLQREQYFSDISYTRLFKKGEIRTSISYFNELMKDRGELRPPYYKTAFDTYYGTQRIIARTHAIWNFGKAYHLDITSAFSIYERNRKKFFRDLVSLEYIPVNTIGENDTSLTYEYFIRPIFASKKQNTFFNFQAGTEFLYSELSTARIVNKKEDVTEYAVFLNTFIYPLKNNKLTVNPGIRYIQNNRYNAPLVYALNFNLQFTHDITLKGSVAKGYRAPNIKELYLDFYFSESIQVYGNSQLKAETSNHYRLSAEWNKSYEKQAWFIEVSTFYNHLTNMITTAQTNITQWNYINIGNFYSQGYSFLLRNKSKYVEFIAGSNYTGFLFLPSKELQNINYYFSPEFICNPSIKLPKYKLFFDINYKYTGKLASQYLSQNNEVKQSYIADYHTVDCSVKRKLWKEKLTFVIGVKNILNITNVPIQGRVYGYSSAKDVTSLPIMWGRTGFISLMLEL
ncbi:MAG: TonB-dependent receptor [Bacteroidetes bacterium]|nr:hypothetical protein [Bacteroidota bacterium]MBV6460394.1 Vitamin B12 transporter BtuB [Flavobacteriales bacterium]MCL4815738.1 TonB-dependent receptor [Flavobacteriales bacterium]NOG95814.1 TonB-dependent receptor [Bacteroidota bacterium]CAG0979453.1 Colicin I receptor [Flavobacteriales bacterium]